MKINNRVPRAEDETQKYQKSDSTRKAISISNGYAVLVKHNGSSR